MTEDQDFQIIVSKQDYANFSKDKVRFKQFQKLFAQLTETNGQLQTQNTLLKKSFCSKKQEIKYLVDLINKFIDKCNQSQPLVQMVDIEQSVYENLVQNNYNGLSSIQAFDLKEHFIKNYQKIQFQLQRISEIASYKHPNCLSIRTKSNGSDVIQQLKPIQIQLQEQRTISTKLLQQKLKLQKELQFYKLKDKQNKYKIQEYQYKTNSNKTNKQEKPYFIKLLIDEYYRDLEVKLKSMNLEKNQIETIVASQMNGIKQYIESTVSKLSINKTSSKLGGNFKK